MNQNSLQTGKAYSNPSLEKYIDERHAEYARQATLLGVTTAVQNTLQSETSLTVLCEPLKNQYDSLVAYAHKHNEGILGIAQAKIQITDIQVENETILKETEQLKTRIAIERNKMGEIIIPSVPYRQLFSAFAIGIILVLADSLMLSGSFAVMGVGYGASIIIGLGVTLSIGLIATLSTSVVEKIESKQTRYLILFALAALIAISVYTLAGIRASFHKIQTGDELGACKLALLSLLTFLASHFLYRYLINPAFKRMKERRDGQDKLYKIKKLENKLDTLKQSYADNLQKIVSIKQTRLALLAYSKSLEKYIVTLYKLSISAFKQSFISQAGYVPECFGEEPTSLQCYYEEINITTNTHEKAE